MESPVRGISFGLYDRRFPPAPWASHYVTAGAWARGKWLPLSPRLGRMSPMKPEKEPTESELVASYEQKVLPYLDCIETSYLREGKTWEEIGESLGIEDNIFYLIWTSKRFTELRAVTHGERADEIRTQAVMESMFRLAVGYDRVTNVPMKVKTSETHIDKRGHAVSNEYETVKIVQYVKHVEPNEDAAKFWLLNKSSGEFKNDATLTLKAQQQPTNEKQVDSVTVEFVDPDTPEQKARIEAIDAKVTAIEAKESGR